MRRPRSSREDQGGRAFPQRVAACSWVAIFFRHPKGSSTEIPDLRLPAFTRQLIQARAGQTLEEHRNPCAGADALAEADA